jgi:hypothetical protein
MGLRPIVSTLNTNVLGLKLIVLWPKLIVLGSKFVLGLRPIVLSKEANEHPKPNIVSKRPKVP